MGGIIYKIVMNKKIIIGLVGETGSGKDTVANHIHKKYGIELLRFGNPLKKTLKFFTDQVSKEDSNWLYGILSNRFGEDVLHNAVRREIKNSKERIICVNGLRMPKDEDFIRSFENNVIIYITADQKLRWKRSVDRAEKSDDKQSFEDFKKFEETAKTERAIKNIGYRAEFKIDNKGSLNDLLTNTNDIINKLIKK